MNRAPPRVKLSAIDMAARCSASVGGSASHATRSGFEASLNGRAVSTGERSRDTLIEAIAWIAFVAATLWIGCAVFFSGYALGSTYGGYSLDAQTREGSTDDYCICIGHRKRCGTRCSLNDATTGIRRAKQSSATALAGDFRPPAWDFQPLIDWRSSF